MINDRTGYDSLALLLQGNVNVAGLVRNRMEEYPAAIITPYLS